MGLSNKSCHAELVSASTVFLVQRFRNKFGMTLEFELIGQLRLCVLRIILQHDNRQIIFYNRTFCKLVEAA